MSVKALNMSRSAGIAARRRVDSLPSRVAGVEEGAVQRDIILGELQPEGGGLILVEAPAGFGKTCLLTQWCARTEQEGIWTAWITLRPADRELVGFAETLIAALKECGFKRLPNGELTAEKDLTIRAQVFAEEVGRSIGGQRGAVRLVLDDYQAIQGGETDDFLANLFAIIPRNLTIALASRRRCPIALSRVMLEGRLRLVGPSELLFSKNEAHELVGHELGAWRLNNVYTVAEGWPAALKIAKLCLSRWPGNATDILSVATFSRLISEYCDREILSQLEEPARTLLSECSMVNVLEAPVCDAIRGRTDSHAILAGLATRETIVEMAEGGNDRWRIPTLLQYCLRQRATEGSRVSSANLLAGAYFERVGRIREALRCYTDAGDPMRAAAALERASPMALISARGDAYGRELFDLIPPYHVEEYPRLALCRAYLDHNIGLIDEAETAMASLAARTANFTRDRPGGNDAKFAAEAMLVKLELAFYDQARAPLDYLDSFEAQIPKLNRSDIRLAAHGHLLVACAFRLRGDLGRSETHLIQTRKLSAEGRSPWLNLWLNYYAGIHALIRGQLAEARGEFLAGLKLWQSDFRTYGVYRAISRAGLAEIDYEANSLREARAKFGESIYYAEHVEGWIELYTSLYELGMMLHWHARQLDELAALLTRGSAVPRIGNLLGRFFHILRVRFELLRGRLDDAQAIIHAQELEQAWLSESHLDAFAYREWDLLGVCLCQLAIRNGSFVDARRFIDILDHEARRAGRARTAMKAQMFRAAVDLHEGDHANAMRGAMEALQTAHPLGLRRVFLDESPVIQPVLEMLVSHPTSLVPASIAEYARSLADTRSGTQGEPTGEKSSLSPRERDVLQELSRGHSNKLIARKLGLSDRTVKFHVTNVFRKLNVRKRAAAVAEAHKRSLLL